MPTAVITVGPTPGALTAPAPLTASFGWGSSTDNGVSVVRTWSWGDGSPDTVGPAPTVGHTFPAGTWTVTLTIEDSSGSDTEQVTVVSYLDVPYELSAALFESDNLTPVLDFVTDVVGSRTFQVALNISDSSQLEVPVLVSDDTTTTVNSESTALTRGRVAQFALNGTPRSAGIVRARDQTSIDSDRNEDGMRRRVAMKGLLSEFRQYSLPPAPGSWQFNIDTRHFGWMSRENDLSAMGTPTFLRPMFDPSGDYSEPWLDAFTYLFDATTDRYFWFDDEVTGSAIDVAAHLGIKDQGTVWLNSEPMGQGATPPESTWPHTQHGGASLGVDTHRWAFDIQALPGASDPWWGALVYKTIDGTTSVIDGSTIRFRTGYSTGTTEYPQWKSSPTPGGCTVKQIARSVINQVQDEQNFPLDWNIYGDDDTIDANGNAFDLIADYPATIGTNLEDFLIGLTAAHCDLKVDAVGKTLYFYRWRERGNFYTSPGSGPVFSGETFGNVGGRIPNIVTLRHEERTQQ